MEKLQLYILVDPFFEKNRGVSTYSDIACKILNPLKATAFIFKRKTNESIEDFRARLNEFYLKNKSLIICIESPETLASSLLLPVTAPVHIRIHFSKVVGNFIQRKAIDEKLQKEEQQAISNAKWISSPSEIALAATKLFFKISQTPYIYPNPKPPSSHISPRPKTDIDILFIGRWERLKGIKFLPNIIRDFKQKKVAIISDVRAKDSINRTQALFHEDKNTNKAEIIHRSRVIILPSLFETVSMVGLEALSFSKPIVAWSHLGICEYEKKPWIQQAIYPDIDDFKQKIRDVLDNEITNMYLSDQINTRFAKGVEDILTNATAKSYMYSQPIEEVHSTDETRRFLEMISANNSSFFENWGRKLRKLKRDPKSFIEDSKLAKSIKKAAHLTPNEQSSHQDKLNPNESKTSKSKTRTVEPPNTFNKKLGHIPLEGKIEYKKPESKPWGMITALFYPHTFDKSKIENLLANLDQFEDFKYIGKERLHIGTFNKMVKGSGATLFERIDSASRQNLAQVNHLILMDPPMNIVHALRACGPFTKIVAIDTEERISNTQGIDAIIRITSKEKRNDTPREIIINSFEALPIAIRRIVQEGAPKEPDMLLPLLGCDKLFRDVFLDFNKKNFQGIIWIKNHKTKPFDNMNDFYKDFSKHISHMAVLESIYLKYRDYCHEIETGGDCSKFLSTCLVDGVVFDIRYVEK